MNGTLTIVDSLANKPVLIAIQVIPHDGPRDERPILMTVGVPEEQALILTGNLGQLKELLDEGWASYAQAVLSQQEAESDVGEPIGTVATESDDDDMPSLYSDDDF